MIINITLAKELNAAIKDFQSEDSSINKDYFSNYKTLFKYMLSREDDTLLKVTNVFLIKL